MIDKWKFKITTLFIALFNAAIIFLFTCFIFSWLTLHKEKTGGYVPLFVGEKEYFSLKDIVDRIWNFKFYGLLAALSHFIVEVVLRKSLFFYFWRQFDNEKNNELYPTACITNCLIEAVRIRIILQNRNTRH